MKNFFVVWFNRDNDAVQCTNMSQNAIPKMFPNQRLEDWATKANPGERTLVIYARQEAVFCCGPLESE